MKKREREREKNLLKLIKFLRYFKEKIKPLEVVRL
jgi:hypothetical protein